MNGAVIFAQNNTSIDYIKLAIYAARQIILYLELPVSLITDNKQWLDSNYPNHPFDKVIEIPNETAVQKKFFHDGALASQKLDWRNHSRSSVYDLTPYDRTLVIDSDYILNSSVLKSAFLNDHEFQIYRNSFDLLEWRPGTEFKRINQYSIPFYWATAFVFTKNDTMKSFFDLVAYIKNNWLYFRNLYSIESPTFRNDFAFSIAIHIMNGKTNGGFAQELPGTMTYITDKDLLVDCNLDKMKFLLEKKDHPGEYILAKTQGIDVHVMNKISLSRWLDGVANV